MNSRRRWTWTLIACLPFLLGTLAAAAVIVTRLDGVFDVQVPLATVLVGCGAIVTAVWVIIAGGRVRRATSFRKGGEDSTRTSVEAHGRFLARLDHELKNPITAIRSALAAESESAPSPNLAVAASQADRLARLVRQLRALATLETQPIESTRVDLSAIVSEEVAALNEELAAHGTHRQISVVLPRTPWALPAVHGDHDLLAVAIRNLLVNAAKYSDEGAPIEVRGSDDGRTVTLDVSDGGWGMPPDEAAQAWDELWRGHAARRVEGTGLGLPLVRVIMKRHGGQVSLRSEPGRGTSVRLVLPAIGR